MRSIRKSLNLFNAWGVKGFLLIYKDVMNAIKSLVKSAVKEKGSARIVGNKVSSKRLKVRKDASRSRSLSNCIPVTLI